MWCAGNVSEHSLPGCTTLVRWQCERLLTWCDATWQCTKLVRPGSEWVLTSLCTTLVRWCVTNAPMWCSGVLFFYHTTQIGFQWLRPGGSHTKIKLDLLSYALFQNVYIFLYFLYISDCWYSNKTGYKKCILSPKNAPKFLFFIDKVCLI